MKKVLPCAVLVACVSLLAIAFDAWAQGGQNVAKEKAFRIERSIPPEAVACIQCHKNEHPGIFADWAGSRHASANITCYDCHRAESFDPDVSQEHYKQYERSDQKYGTQQYRVPVAAVVTPKDCSRCHPDEASQYAVSNTPTAMTATASAIQGPQRRTRSGSLLRRRLPDAGPAKSM